MIVPSFVAKVARAKQHLIDLETEVGRFAAAHPYTVRETVQGKRKRKVRTVEFTASPANTDIPLIAADAIYNLRSALDHLMSSIVPGARRTSVMFPVFFQGVWEPAVPGEDGDRLKQRARWASAVKGLPAPAVAILQALQPPDTGRKTPDETDAIRLVNRLSNADRHTKLPVVAAGLTDARFQFREPDGTVRRAVADPAGARVLKNGAQLENVPYNAMDVQVQGTALVAIQGGDKVERFLEIPRQLVVVADRIERDVIPALSPFVRS